MKIVHIFLSLPVGGAEDLVLSLVRRQSPQDEVKVLCLRNLGVAGEEAKQEGLPVELLLCAPSKRLSIIGLLRLAQWLKNEGVEAVHSHVYNAHVYAVLAASIAGIPSVIHHHKTFKRDRLHRSVILRILSRLAAVQIALSENTREELLKAMPFPKTRFHVLENCVDSAAFYPAPNRAELRKKLGVGENVLIVGAIASLTSPKNHLATIRMVSAVRSEDIPVTAIVCGEGNLRPILQEEVDKLHLGSHLQLVGNKRPITPWLQILDLLVLPSLWEGQPMILIQAMACSIPIIASDIEGNIAALGREHPGLFDSQNSGQYIEMVKEFFKTNRFKDRILSYQNEFFKRKPSFDAYAQELHSIYRTLLPPRSG